MEFLVSILPVWIWCLILGGFALLGLTSLVMGTLRYELREDAVCILVLGRVVRRVPYSNIESVRQGPLLLAEKWRRKSPDPDLGLRQRDGLFIYVLINPPNGKEFMQQLNQRLAARPDAGSETTPATVGEEVKETQ